MQRRSADSVGLRDGVLAIRNLKFVSQLVAGFAGLRIDFAGCELFVMRTSRGVFGVPPLRSPGDCVLFRQRV